MMEDMLFADLDIPTHEEEDVEEEEGSKRGPTATQRSQARLRMKKILAGEIEVQLSDLPLDAMHHIQPSVTPEIVRVLTKQLGFTPLNLVEVSYCHPITGQPQVLKLYPLNVSDPTLGPLDSQTMIPFPTMYWVSCPILHATISKIEEEGWVQRLTDRLLHSPESTQALQEMERAHRLYAQERWTLLTEEDQEFVIESGWEEPLRHVGVAGMRNFASIKCLHTHFAHFASRPDHGNIIGRWVMELLQEHQQQQQQQGEVQFNG